MYYKINKTGCTERGGLAQVRFDLYLEPSDPGYNDYHVEVPVIPPEGYTGKKDTEGNPVDAEGFKVWLEKLPKEKRDNPFCCHFCQFEPSVTDEEILYVGELALDMAFSNYSDLKKNKNIPVAFSADETKKGAARSRVDAVLETDFAKLKTIGAYRVK